jgi:hypothetical protein
MVTNMRYQGTKVKPYSEPITSNRLKLGEVYFSLQFADPDLLIPIMEPYVFLGQDLNPRAKGLFYFQRVESYQRGVRYKASGKRNMNEFQVARSNGMNHIFEYERALDVLLSCAARRASRGKPIEK